MVTVLRAFSLLAELVFVASAATFDNKQTQQHSCSNGTYSADYDVIYGSPGSQVVWSGIYGGKNGFRLSRIVVTTVNTTTTFPSYCNLLDVVGPASGRKLAWSYFHSSTFDIKIPAGEQGAMYYTPTILCQHGTLNCDDRNTSGQLCSAIRSHHPKRRGTFGFVSQGGSSSHPRSAGHRVKSSPGKLHAPCRIGAKAKGHHNDASQEGFSIANVLLPCLLSLWILLI